MIRTIPCLIARGTTTTQTASSIPTHLPNSLTSVCSEEPIPKRPTTKTASMRRLSRAELRGFSPDWPAPLLSQRRSPNVPDMVLPVDFSQLSSGRRGGDSRRVVFIQGDEAPLVGRPNRDQFLEQSIASKLHRLEEMRSSLQSAIEELEGVRYTVLLASKSKILILHFTNS